MLQPKDRPAEWIQKQDPYICCLSAYTDREIYRLKVRGEKDILSNGNKNAGVAAFISDKIVLKIKTVTVFIKKQRDKEWHHIMAKGSTQEEDTILNIYAPNIGAPQYIKQMVTASKGEINSKKIIVGYVNTPTWTNGQIIQTENQ